MTLNEKVIPSPSDLSRAYISNQFSNDGQYLFVANFLPEE